MPATPAVPELSPIQLHYPTLSWFWIRVIFKSATRDKFMLAQWIRTHDFQTQTSWLKHQLALVLSAWVSLQNRAVYNSAVATRAIYYCWNCISIQQMSNCLNSELLLPASFYSLSSLLVNGNDSFHFSWVVTATPSDVQFNLWPFWSRVLLVFDSAGSLVHSCQWLPRVVLS